MTMVMDSRAMVPAAPLGSRPDRRGSWIPTGAMIGTRIMELRKRRGIMIALVVVNIGIPTLFLVIRLLSHAIAPNSYGPAGGYNIYTAMVAGVLYVFGFIVAATLGCTAGSVDLSEGMFRHLVVTGRSRLALYLARIPAGLAIIVPLVATGFAVVCAVCVFAAPTQISDNGVNVPAHLSRTGFVSWATNHPGEVLCNFNYGPQKVGPSSQNGPSSQIATTEQNIPCGPGPHGAGVVVQPPPGAAPLPSESQMRAAAASIAAATYTDYSHLFLYPSNSLMIKSGLWIELEALIGFVVGLGLASLLGQRTVTVVLMIVLEVILTPIVSMHVIPHLINAERAVVGLATLHVEPAALPLPFSGGGGPGGGGGSLIPESTTVAVCVIVAWLVVWTALGAWRMMTRDA